MSSTAKWTIGIIVIVIIAILWFLFDARNIGLTPTKESPVSTSTPATTPVAPATTTASTNTSQPTKNLMHTVTIETNMGKIVLETYDADAPNTVKNFISLIDKGFYNGLIFHRVIKDFMIQGGDPTGTGSGGPGYQFADELNPATASYKAGYVRGTLAMANAGPNTNGSQFFIMHKDMSLPHNYTIFGRVVSGQDIVDKIAAVKVGAQDRPVSPVTMTKVVEAAK